jgi:hypothetical protein
LKEGGCLRAGAVKLPPRQSIRPRSVPYLFNSRLLPCCPDFGIMYLLGLAVNDPYKPGVWRKLVGNSRPRESGPETNKVLFMYSPGTRVPRHALYELRSQIPRRKSKESHGFEAFCEFSVVISMKYEASGYLWKEVGVERVLLSNHTR